MKTIGLLKAMALTYKADKMTDCERTKLQQKRLRELIAYAKNNSPYFARLYQDVDENTPLSELPPTNKIALMEHFDEWMTDRGECRFTINMGGNAVVRLTDSRLLITDLDENRFEIPDVFKLSQKEQRKLDLFL